MCNLSLGPVPTLQKILFSVCQPSQFVKDFYPCIDFPHIPSLLENEDSDTNNIANDFRLMPFKC